MSELRILLADDHPVVREGMKALLAGVPGLQVIGEAEDGETACRQAAALHPDVLVMDVSMPRLNGADATQRIREDSPGTRVLAVTVHEDPAYLRRLLEAGASGYLLKRAAATELLHAIRTVAAGGTYLDPSMAGKLVTAFVRNGNVGERQAPTELSERETSVLRLIARGYSIKEIAAQLQISVKTVETYKARSTEKLGLDSRVDIVRYAMQRGWLD